MKMRREHLVPLSRQAVTILRELEPLTRRRGAALEKADYLVFPPAYDLGTGQLARTRNYSAYPDGRGSGA